MRSGTKLIIRDYGITILIALTVALFVRFFVIEAYRIPSPAMRPTLEPGDTIFVEKWNLTPRRGDVIVFSFPSSPKRDYIKRIVGMPGETVAVRNGRILIDGKPAEARLPANASCGTEKLPGAAKPYEVCWEPPIIEDFGPEKVPDGNVFVIGDYRSQPLPEAHKTAPATPTARTWGMVADTSIKGRAAWIWLSIEPPPLGSRGGWFPNFRFDRMFRRIE